MAIFQNNLFVEWFVTFLFSIPLNVLHSAFCKSASSIIGNPPVCMTKSFCLLFIICIAVVLRGFIYRYIYLYWLCGYIQLSSMIHVTTISVYKPIVNLSSHYGVSMTKVLLFHISPLENWEIKDPFMLLQRKIPSTAFGRINVLASTLLDFPVISRMPLDMFMLHTTSLGTKSVPCVLGACHNPFQFLPWVYNHLLHTDFLTCCLVFSMS